MLDRLDHEPVFFAPIVSSIMGIEPAWIDFNGHLNMAYYNVLFDRACDEAFELARIGASYVRAREHSFFAAEVHVRYLRELKIGTPVRATFQLIDYDHKRVHFFQQLFHATEGWVSATSENLALHVDLGKKKTANFPDDVLATFARMKTSHGQLPRPEACGRRVGIPGRA
jgi:acyl-CoA thioester hydrolase